MMRTAPTHYDLSRLRGSLKPYRLHWFPRLRSTSDHAAVMRRRGDLFAPAIVLTGHQTAGRGRGSNTWWSTDGVLTVTIVLPINPDIAPHQVPLLAGLALREAVDTLVPHAGVQLKWPNDLLCEGRKLAGLLCERLDQVDLIGLGLNVNVDPALAPLPLRKKITSLSSLSGQLVDVTSVVLVVARHLHRQLSQPSDKSFASLLREYDRHHALIGRRVMVSGGPDEQPMSGTVEGLDATGRLLLRDGAVLHRIIAGQVTII